MGISGTGVYVLDVLAVTQPSVCKHGREVKPSFLDSCGSLYAESTDAVPCLVNVVSPTFLYMPLSA